MHSPGPVCLGKLWQADLGRLDFGFLTLACIETMKANDVLFRFLHSHPELRLCA